MLIMVASESPFEKGGEKYSIKSAQDLLMARIPIKLQNLIELNQCFYE